MRSATASKRRITQRSKPDSLPPDTQRLERSILGGIIDDPSLYGVVPNLGLLPEQFSLSAHRTIFGCMATIAQRGHVAELPEIVRELEQQKQLEAVGGAGYVAGLSDGIVATRSSLARDIVCLLNRNLVREFCRAAEELAEYGSRPDVQIGQLVSAAKGKLLKFETAAATRLSLHKTDPVLEGGLLLSRLGEFIERYISLKPAQRDVLALWVMHTHTFPAADATAYISVMSAEMRSGKTRVLELMNRLVAKPWFTARVSAAVLTRKIAQEEPTLLLDESDTAFHSDKEYAEALRGVLNSGHRRGGVISLCVKGAEITCKDFETFSPKMIAGIGHLPDTVSDRSIPIQLKRKVSREGSVERFHFATVEALAKPLREAVAAWAEANLNVLRESHPSLPEPLNDRQQDGAEPLLAIADRAGGVWPDRARAALIEVFRASPPEDSVRVRLLADTLTVFQEMGAERLSSEDLKNALLQIETSPWPEWNHGRPLTPTALARLLKPFQIFPKSIRIGSGTPKGYDRASFMDSWERYLPKANAGALGLTSEPQQPPQEAIRTADAYFSTPPQTPNVAVSKSAESPIFAGFVAAVAPHPVLAPENIQEKRRRVEEI
jgi:hypothetical protein